MERPARAEPGLPGDHGDGVARRAQQVRGEAELRGAQGASEVHEAAGECCARHAKLEREILDAGCCARAKAREEVGSGRVLGVAC